MTHHMVTTTTTTRRKTRKGTRKGQGEYDAADNRGEGQGKERRNVMSLQTLLSTPPHPIPRVYKAPNMGLRKLAGYNIELTELQYTAC